MKTLPPLSRRQAIALVAIALVVRVLAPPAPHAAAPHVELAFFAFIMSFLSFLWGGLSTVAAAIAQAALWLAQAAWAALVWVGNTISKLGGALADVGRGVWNGLKATYAQVLRPAWQKFWNVVDRVQRTLTKIFQPVIDVLVKIRRRLLALYDRFVRPVLDIFDVTRKALRVLAALHIEWAKKLDGELGQIESWISENFQRLVQRVNEAIEAVNTIMTVDGLFQRLALIRSIERDLQIIADEFASARERPLTDADHDARRKLATKLTLDEVRENAAAYFTNESGPYSERVDELVRLMRPHLIGL